jgi:hypothetical protein
MVADIIYVYDLSIDVQNNSIFYCSILIMLQRELLGFLEALA